jgi:hypothetical protein
MKLFLNFGKTSMTIAIDKLSFADYPIPMEAIAVMN